jgi:ribosomal protein S18 acetylase RimI-like enzyme
MRLSWKNAPGTQGATISARAGEGLIGLIAVDSGFRREGVGQALLAGADNSFLENGCLCARIVTKTDNVAACGLFESCGSPCTKG